MNTQPTVYVGGRRVESRSELWDGWWSAYIEGQDWPVHVREHEFEEGPPRREVTRWDLVWGGIVGFSAVFWIAVLYGNASLMS